MCKKTCNNSIKWFRTLNFLHVGILCALWSRLVILNFLRSLLHPVKWPLHLNVFRYLVTNSWRHFPRSLYNFILFTFPCWKLPEARVSDTFWAGIQMSRTSQLSLDVYVLARKACSKAKKKESPDLDFKNCKCFMKVLSLVRLRCRMLL